MPAYPNVFYHPVHGGRMILNQEQHIALGIAAWQIPRGVIGEEHVGRNLANIGDATPVLSGDALRLSDKIAFYVEWSDGVTDGTLNVTTAHDPSYLGQWAPRLEIAFSDGEGAGSVTHITFTDTGLHAAVRVEVTSPIVGGFVNIYPFTA